MWRDSLQAKSGCGHSSSELHGGQQHSDSVDLNVLKPQKYPQLRLPGALGIHRGLEVNAFGGLVVDRDLGWMSERLGAASREALMRSVRS